MLLFHMYFSAIFDLFQSSSNLFQQVTLVPFKFRHTFFIHQIKNADF